MVYDKNTNENLAYWDSRPEMEIPSLSTAIEKYVSAKRAIRMSENTLNGYGVDFRRLVQFLDGDPLVSEIDTDTIRGLLLSMEDASNKTLLNTHVALSSLWTWMVSEEYIEEHILRKIRRPRYHPKKVEPFTLEELRAMLAQASFTRLKERDRAIIRFLVDTGVRASEMCSMKVQDLQKDFAYVKKGKGSKTRIVPISERTMVSVKYYLSKRHHADMEDALFASERYEYGGHLTRHGLRHMIYRLADMSGVQNAYPHRFRHTFAINYLRNGGDIYTLQEILGHTTLDMVRRYLAISKVDIRLAHKKASPVEVWSL